MHPLIDHQSHMNLIIFKWSNGLVVMISVLHSVYFTEGLQFDPGLDQLFAWPVINYIVNDFSADRIRLSTRLVIVFR